MEAAIHCQRQKKEAVAQDAPGIIRPARLVRETLQSLTAEIPTSAVGQERSVIDSSGPHPNDHFNREATRSGQISLNRHMVGRAVRRIEVEQTP